MREHTHAGVMREAHLTSRLARRCVPHRDEAFVIADRNVLPVGREREHVHVASGDVDRPLLRAIGEIENPDLEIAADGRSERTRFRQRERRHPRRRLNRRDRGRQR